MTITIRPHDLVLRALAEEMRSAPTHWGSRAWRDQACAWADRISPPKPEPLQIGDRVRNTDDGTLGEIKSTEHEWLWVVWDEGPPSTMVLSDLERIP